MAATTTTASPSLHLLLPSARRRRLATRACHAEPPTRCRLIADTATTAAAVAVAPLLLPRTPAARAAELSEWERVPLPIDPGVVLLDVAFVPNEPSHEFTPPLGERESMEGLTESEIAGFVVGALLLGASIAAQRVDGFIATSQRRSLNMCKRCGDLRMVACSQCKGVGSVRKGGTTFTFGILDDMYESLGAETKAADLVACPNCRSKGRLRCPECSKGR